MAWSVIGQLPITKKDTLSGVLSAGDALLVWSKRYSAKGNDSHVYRFDLATQRRLWQVGYTESYSLSTPSPYLILQNKLPGAKDSSIRRVMQAFRIEDGTLVWERANSAISHQIKSSDIFLLEKRGKEVLWTCLSPETGEIQHKKLFPHSLISLSSIKEIFLGYMNGRYLVFDREGVFRYELPSSRERAIPNIALDTNGNVYFETDKEKILLHYWDLAQGKEISVWPLYPRPQMISPLSEPGKVLLLLAGSQESSLGLFDAITGKFIWQRDLGAPRYPGLRVTSHGVWVFQDGLLRLFSLDDGECLSESPELSGIQSFMWSGTHLVHSTNGTIYKYRSGSSR
jgi:outer membrane protein assembly factor BamB